MSFEFFKLPDGSFVMVSTSWHVHGSAGQVLAKMQELSIPEEEIVAIFTSLGLHKPNREPQRPAALC